MKTPLRFFLFASCAALVSAILTGCTCSGGSEENKECMVDTVIIENDTLVLPKIMPKKNMVSPDSVALLDTSAFVPAKIKAGKVYNQAPPFPAIEQEHIVTDSLGRRTLDNRLCVIIKKQSANSSILDKWERQFKTLYPDSQYYVTYKEPFALVMQIAVPADKRDEVRDEIKNRIKDINFMIVDEELTKPQGDYVPNDPIFNNDIFHILGYDYYFDMIQAKRGWSYTKGSPKIVVAVLDNYFDLNHPELNGCNIVEPYSVITATRDVLPPVNEESSGHGTLVASLAVGQMDNNRGACGIAPGCSFMPISIGGPEVATSAVVVGIFRAIHSGADVINVSLGWAANFSEEGMSIKDQIKWSRRHLRELEEFWGYVYEVAAARNVVIVYAAGNERDYIAVNPQKRSDNIISVSSVDMDGHWSCMFSNVGNFPQYDAHASTLSAPGEYMFGALPGNDYQIDLTPSCGTSYAAPLVTGAVALIKSIDNSLSTKEIIEILQKTGKPVQGVGGSTIGNIIQVGDALEEVQIKLSCFNDFVRNPIGLWGSIEQTKCYNILDEETGECGPYAGQTRMYFRIKSLSEYGICGEQITCQVTDVKRLVHWEMKDWTSVYYNFISEWKNGMRKSRIVMSEDDLINNTALVLSSYNYDGHLSDWNGHGFWGAVRVALTKGPNGELVAHTWDKWNRHYSYTLKRCKKIKREYKAEL